MKTILAYYKKMAFEVQVSDEDFEELSKYRWTAKPHWLHGKSGKRYDYGFKICRSVAPGIEYDWVRPGLKSRQVYMHRQIMKPPLDMEVDHIDGNKMNNQRNNLRIVTKAQNRYNRAWSKSRLDLYKGVKARKAKDGGYEAQIGQFGKLFVIGSNYRTEIEAAEAYDREAVKRFGEYAVTNFPTEGAGRSLYKKPG